MYLPQPLLPDLAIAFGVADTTVAGLVSVVTLAIAVGSPVLAVVSDRFGRKPLMVMATAAMVPAALACALAPSVTILYPLRAVQGALVAVVLSSGWAYLGEEFEPAVTRTMAGAFVASTVTGGVLSRWLGGGVGEVLGWRGAFVSVAVVASAASVWAARSLPASTHFAPSVDLASAVRDSLRHWTHPGLLRMYGIGFAIFFSFLGTFNALPFLLSGPPFDLSAAAIGAVYVTYLAGAVSSPLAARWSRRWSPRTVAAAAAVVTAAGHLVTWGRPLEGVMAGLTLLCFAHFIVQSTASAWVATTASRARAGASAHYLFSYYLGGSIGSLVSVAIWNRFGWGGVVVVGATMMLVAAGLALSTSRGVPRDGEIQAEPT